MYEKSPSVFVNFNNLVLLTAMCRKIKYISFEENLKSIGDKRHLNISSMKQIRLILILFELTNTKFTSLEKSGVKINVI